MKESFFPLPDAEDGRLDLSRSGADESGETLLVAEEFRVDVSGASLVDRRSGRRQVLGCLNRARQGLRSRVRVR